MTHQGPSQAESAYPDSDDPFTDDDASSPSPPPHPHGLALFASLKNAWRLAQERSQLQGGVASPLHACLLLEAWAGTEIADWIESKHPELAAERLPFTDPLYADRENEAPCVVALPDGWADEQPEGAAAAFAEILPHWLQTAAFASAKRLYSIVLCGVVFCSAPPEAVALHGTRLAWQHSPLSGAPRFFRHFDPRVMQRAWPRLSEAQRHTWLGPAQIVWAIEQPWGPWPMPELLASDLTTLRDPPGSTLFVAPPEADAVTQALDPHRLLDAPQWHAAHAAPMGNRAWLRLAENDIAPQDQPDGDAMSTSILVGAQHGLTGVDLECFVDASWVLPSTRQPRAHAIDWTHEPWASALPKALAQMQNTPDTGFRAAWRQAQPKPESTGT